jgi:ABC-type sugar transport system permease subunit
LIRRSKKKFRLLPYLLILPTAAFVALFTAWPVLLSIYQSFLVDKAGVSLALS